MNEKHLVACLTLYAALTCINIEIMAFDQGTLHFVFVLYMIIATIKGTTEKHKWGMNESR
jgi:hypothetical protein